MGKNMRIDLNNTAASQIANEQSAKVTQKYAQPSGNVEDTASLSSDSVSLSSLGSQAMQAPDVRQEKVDALRQAIGNGTYSVSPDQIAEAMLRDKSQ